MNAIAHRTSSVSPRAPVLTPQTFEQLMTFADMAANSQLVPKDYQGKPANIVIAVQMGAELGLQPMQSLTSIAVINGRPGVWGDGLIGLCRQSPLCEDIREWFEGEGETLTAFCEAKRRNSSPVLNTFSVADAKKAGLFGKQGPWSQYLPRMLKNRARGFTLRDAFPDLLRGLKTVEELEDYPREERVVKATEVVTEPPRRRPAPPTASAAPTMDAVLDGDQIPDWDTPKPDHLRKVADRIKLRLTEARDQDAYNAIMQHVAIQAEWDRIKRDRPELAAEIEETRASVLDAIAADHQPEPA